MTDFDYLKNKAAAMPQSAGVYLMKDVQGRVIYVGKAKILPKRVTTYFQKVSDSLKTARMVSLVADLDFIVTDTEKEALILENNLIKKHRPRYNIFLRDDKTYPYLKLTVQEDYPRLEVVRRIVRDGSEYFGPFTSATAMRQTMRLIKKLFPLRQCRRPEVTAVDRPCLNFQLGRCLGPCHGHISREEYRSLVDEVVHFFKGRNKDLTDSLRRKMKEAAERLDFEGAARYRDRLHDVERTLETQKVFSSDMKDRDVIGVTVDRGQTMAVILFLRRGILLGSRGLPLSDQAETLEEAVESVLMQYYDQDRLVPEEILVPVPLQNRVLIEDWLKERRGKSVRLYDPARGPKRKLVELAVENAVTALAERRRAAEAGTEVQVRLQGKLGLPTPACRIEGYDMSTLRGDAPVGAMVVMENGKWVKADYRRYRIKSASGQDDYAMMSEVLGRRLSKDDLPRPDLILLDGGRGQLGVVMAVLEDLGLIDPPPVAGLAKGRDGEADKVWLPGRKNPVDLRADSPELLLLMRIRDEAHRFVRTFHHRLRASGSTRSILDGIPGIGPARRKALLQHFGSLEAVKKAGLEELAQVKGMNSKAALVVQAFFHE
jgi:excinuclease ABC subunit C